jgi:hypothetical protein
MDANTLTQSLIDTKPVRILGIGLLLALLSACGTEVAPRSTSLFSVSGPSTSSLVVGGQVNTQCSTFDSTSTRLAGKVTTYYKNGVMQEDQVRVRITSMLETFDTNSSYYIQAFRWKVDGSGMYLDPTPVQMQFENGAGSDTPISDLLTSVNLTTISSIRTAKSISGTGSVDFFSKTTLVVKGVDYNWQALKIVIYDGSNKVVGQSDFLLPIFQADPNTYAASHASNLAAIHPFYSQRSQTGTDWGAATKSFCF